MRVAGGQLRGRVLRAPAGRVARPTRAVMREALFAALEARLGGLGGMRALDLFAGSGALGIEALSRGCAEAWFVERHPGALAALRANLSALGLQARSRVLAGDVWAALRGRALAAARFELVLADPPYALGSARVVPAVAAAAWLGPAAWCAFEHGAREELPARSGTLMRVWHRAHGGSAISVYARGRETWEVHGCAPASTPAASIR